VHTGTGKAKAGPRVQHDMVTMYSTPWCGYCRRLKIQLEAAGIEFCEVDVDRDAAAAQFVMSVNDGDRTIPVIRFADGSTATNPRLAQVQQRLQELAA